MIKTGVILAVLGSVGGTISALTWVPDAVDSTRDFMVYPAVVAVDRLASVHKEDMRQIGVEMATSLHRAIEASNIGSRIHDFKLEVIKLRMELRQTTSAPKTREIERDINRLEKDIEREKDRMDNIEKLTKAQIGELIGNECCEHDST